MKKTEKSQLLIHPSLLWVILYNTDIVSEVNEIPGQGIKFIMNGTLILVGNAALLKNESVTVPDKDISGTAVHIAVDGIYAGYVVAEDSVKDKAETAILELRKCGAERMIMLSGDKKPVAERVGKSLGIDEVKSELLPSDKVFALEKILESNKKSNTVAYVGDGVNDAPVLGRADIGIAMGGEWAPMRQLNLRILFLWTINLKKFSLQYDLQEKQ